MLGEHPGLVELVRVSGPVLEPIDIALYDIVTNGPDQGPTIAQLLADSRIRKVAVYTWNFQPWSAVELIEEGASAYLSKSLSGTELVEALQAVQRGRTIISPDTRAGHPSQALGAENGEELTEREAEVLSLISSGLSNAEIADQLRLSLNSVKSYIRTGYRKIDVDSRTKAVIWGLAHGLGPHALYDRTGEPRPDPGQLSAIDAS